MFVRRRQQLVRQALSRGDLESARAAACGLEPGDFDGAILIVEVCLRVLGRDDSTDGSVRAALKILGRLPIRFA